ncbi:MAG: DUF6382 domain-containing protein [Lachnospiraceae bacterium]|nr:DUF6382 domain-containing protein [Lachnospiraceae bacterium]
MKAEFKRDLKNNYLVLEGQEEAVENDYCIPMVEQNRIPGLLPFHRSRTDGKLYLNYEITGKQTVASLYERRRIGYEEMVQLLMGIIGHLDMLQRYLLSPEQLLFDPQYIFTDPDGRGIWFCYVPQKEAEISIVQLAEFFLKRLNHQDPAAVELGYRFYARTQEENLSLSRMLQELLTDCKMGEKGSMPDEKTVREERNNLGMKDSEADRVFYAQVQGTGTDSEHGFGEKRAKSQDKRTAAPEEIPNVIHRERKTEKKKKRNMFRIVHPAVLLTSLLLFAVLEIVFYYGYLNVTEAGGCFFLILSGELLANSLWKRKKEENGMAQHGIWQEEEEEEEEQEEYGQLRREMYQSPGVQQDLFAEDRIEETRCLTDVQEPCGMRLIYIQPEGNAGEDPQVFPDIYIGTDAVTVGKLQGQCEVLLNASTVSRIHARLEYRKGIGYIRDLNSRNGTFLNGEHLEPQELRSFTEGARIAFADIQYRAVHAHTPF